MDHWDTGCCNGWNVICSLEKLASLQLHRKDMTWITSVLYSTATAVLYSRFLVFATACSARQKGRGQHAAIRVQRGTP